MRLPLHWLLALPLFLPACKSMHSDDADQSLILLGGEISPGPPGWHNSNPAGAGQVAFTFRGHGSSTGAEIGMQLGFGNTQEAGLDRSFSIGEVFIGPFKEWQFGSRVSLLAGAGLRYAEAETDVAGLYADRRVDGDDSTGVYAHVGLYFRVTQAMSLGADVRWADGWNYHIEGASHDARLTQILYGLRFGF
ncbi:MAG: hypothetical protein IPJ19_13525 [Planctomycetes bacterium]|nr:hypothetical protein [Planctomycetota bacterium]